MRLLFDQNISFRLVRKVQSIFPDAKQVRELGLENAKDKEIWQYAKKNNYVIVTFDVDFVDLNVLYGHPPKIVWLRIGNIKTDFLVLKLEEKANEITSFVTEDKYSNIGCLEIIG
jgi:predicted nuclease of predicted toxin-antitoxin system